MTEQIDPLADVIAALDADDERAGKVGALAGAATEGPWHVAKTGGIDAGEYDTVIGCGPVDCMAYCYGGTSTLEGDNLDADREFIAASRTETPWLVERLRARDEAIRAVLGLAAEWDALPCVHGYRIPNGNDDESQCLSCAALDLLAALASALGGGEQQ